MRRNKIKGVFALLLSFWMTVQSPFANILPLRQVFAYTEKSAHVNATSLNVRSGAGTSHSIVAKLSHGTSVMVLDETVTADGKVWYKIRFSAASGVETIGYASKDYIKFPVTYTTDGSFENYLNQQGFPESYKSGLRILHAQYPNWVFTAQHTGLDWNTVIQNESIVGRNLVSKSSASSWKSIADGAYNWDNSSWPGFDGSSWVAASEDIIRYYIDPRNFLDETYAFLFLKQSYDASVHTKDGLRLMVKGSFLEEAVSEAGTPPNASGSVVQPDAGTQAETSSGGERGPGVKITPITGDTSSETQASTQGAVDNSVPTGSGNTGIGFESPQASIEKHEVDRVATGGYGPGMTGSAAPPSNVEKETEASGGTSNTGSRAYVDMIMDAGIQSGVNPYVLAAMIIQEQGTKGTSGSISGTAAGYAGYYNFFNIEAYQSGNLSAIQRGLWYASQSGNYNRPWNSREKSIVGGSVYYGNNYVKVGQDTFYLKKFNVQGSNLYKHQYMTNIQGAAGEAAKLSQAYSDQMKQTPLEFKIPVYQNMPGTACARPTGDGSPNNKLSELRVEGFALTPTFSKDTLSYDLIVDHSVQQVTIGATTADAKASVSGSGTVQLQSGNNEMKVTVKAQNGMVREYILQVVRRNGGPVYSGGGGASAGNGSTGQNQENPTSGNAGMPGGNNVTVISPIG